MAEGLATTDENYRLTYVNHRFCSILGYTSDELIGRHASELIDIKDHEWFARQIAVLPRGECHRQEVSCVKKDGTRLPAIIAPMPILDGMGKFIGSFAVLSDLTELKAAEESLRNSEAQLRSLSFELLKAHESERRRIALDLHDDLGQELTSAKLQIGFIRSQLPRKEKELRGECASAIKLVAQVLEKVRKLSHDLNPLIVDDLGFSAALRWLVHDFGRLRKVKTSLKAAPIDHLLPKEAAIILYRIFQEILTNIGKHARAGQVSITMQSRDGKISFLVADDGIGFKMNGSDSGKFSGLGLLTIRERVNMLGGFFELSSLPGKGTRLKFEIPIRGVSKV